jgi:hypothetical protein
MNICVTRLALCVYAGKLQSLMARAAFRDIVRTGEIKSCCRMREFRIALHLPGICSMTVPAFDLDGTMRRCLCNGSLKNSNQQSQRKYFIHHIFP